MAEQRKHSLQFCRHDFILAGLCNMNTMQVNDRVKYVRGAASPRIGKTGTITAIELLSVSHRVIEVAFVCWDGSDCSLACPPENLEKI